MQRKPSVVDRILPYLLPRSHAEILPWKDRNKALAERTRFYIGPELPWRRMARKSEVER